MADDAPIRQQAMDERIAARRAEVRREGERRRRRGLRSVALLVVLLAALAGLARSPLMAVTEVRVTGATETQATEVRDAAGIDVGENLLAADVGAAEAAVTGLAWVADAEVVRQPPATVEVRVTSRIPFAVLRLVEESWTLDAGGVVLAGGAPEGLVRIDAPEAPAPRPGQVLDDPAVTAALEFHEYLPGGFAERVQRYEAHNAHGLRMEVMLDDERLVWVLVGGAEQVELKAEVTEALLDQASGLLEDGPEGFDLDVRAPGNPVLVPRGEQ